MDDAVAKLKRAHRSTWAGGDWDTVSRLITDVGPRVLDLVGLDEGMDLLDVGTGSGGTIAIPAALRGARVVGSDLTPEHFDAARRRAAEAGVEVEWVEADAEALPFADEAFDRVISTFGHMFAPRHALAGAELARVCRPGGRVGVATWTPEGWTGEMFKAVSARMPPPPAFAEPPWLWGVKEHVREMLEPHGLELEFHEARATFTAESPDAFVTLYEEKFGPVVAAKAALGDGWPALRTDLLELFERRNLAEDGTFRVEPEFLVTVGSKRG
jgi:ubiquinone/menaquinone biosynthesis C-methylase UbiE